MTLKCECGNKNRKKLIASAYITGPECSDDEPGTVYINIECSNCNKSFDIKNCASFDNVIMIYDDYIEEPLDFSKRCY